MKQILQDFVDTFNATKPLFGVLTFSEKPLPVDTQGLSGQLLTFYQHLSIKDDCYFGHQFFDIVLLPHQSQGTLVETWALQDIEAFEKGDFLIFAQTPGDDIIFCDLREEKCPVYGMISGWDEMFKLGDSLSQFLTIYIKLVRIEVVEFAGDLYVDDNSTYKPDFVEAVYQLIKANSNGLTQQGLLKFTLSGLVDLTDDLG